MNLLVHLAEKILLLNPINARGDYQPSIPHLSRSDLHRCLQRHGISPLPDVKGKKEPKKKFKSYPIGYFHIDIAEVQTGEGKLYLFVAIDRTIKFAFAQLVEKANRVTASAFLVALIEACPYKIHTILTDNGIQFRYPPRYADGPTTRYFRHMFEYAAGKMASGIASPSPTIHGQMGRLKG